MASPLILRNESTLDRVIRLALGAALIAVALTGPKNPLGWVGLVPLATGAFGFCPLYRVFGFSTRERRSR